MSDEHMSDKDMDAVLREWTQDAPAGRPDRSRVVGNVVGRLGSTRRRRWWLLRLFDRKPDEPAAIDKTHYHPSPIPASNGHTPTVIGRTSSMLSPAKAITAGAIVFAIGGAFLIAQPFDQQGGVPGAEAEAIAPTWVTGTIRSAPSCSGSDIVWDGDVGRRRNAECSPQRWTSSDPRLTGDVVRRWSDDIYQTDEGAIWVSMSAAYLRNDDGGWACSSSDLLKGIGTTGSGTTVEEELVNGGTTTFDCVGDGGYEGLSALLVSEFTTGFNEEFSGLIFSGDFPPLPEPPAAD